MANFTLLTVVFIALIQGLLDFYSLAMFYYYKNDLELTASQISLVQSIIILPWTIKPLLGLITDHIAIFGSRRKSYLLLACSFEAFGLICLSRIPRHLALVVFLHLSNTLCLVFRNVIGEAILVESARSDLEDSVHHNNHNQQQKAQRKVSFFFGSRSLGSLISSYSSGYALSITSKANIFLISSGFSLFLLTSVLFIFKEQHATQPELQEPILHDEKNPLINEPQDPTLVHNIEDSFTRYEFKGEYHDSGFSQAKKGKPNNNVVLSRFGAPSTSNSLFEELKVSFEKISEVLTNQKVKSMLCFVMLVLFCPNLAPTFNYYYTDVMRLDSRQMGTLSFVSSFAYLSGILAVNTVFRSFKFKKFYVSTNFVSAMFNLVNLLLLFKVNQQYGVPDFAFALVTNSFATFLIEINFLPVLAFCCRVCPKNLEATTYAVFTALFNAGAYFSGLLGSALVYIFHV